MHKTRTNSNTAEESVELPNDTVTGLVLVILINDFCTIGAGNLILVGDFFCSNSGFLVSPLQLVVLYSNSCATFDITPHIARNTKGV
ncbi:hypothetical protein EZV62_019292 [Acer yangbiense]|uniref:Uncharacterized protein n=1 Tax=Acer yangbiense TaxID=1000413 RepID=A0A5C7HCX3_9ROSI|nr:hypothetical protein EZV62_019292 [Acer yangbiense]